MRVCLAQGPRLLTCEISVRFRHDAPYFGKRVMESEIFHRGTRFRADAVGFGEDNSVGFGKLAERRHLAIEVLRDHRQRPLREIAKVVGEIGIDPLHDSFMRIRAVLSKRCFAQQEVAERIDAVGAHQRGRDR